MAELSAGDCDPMKADCLNKNDGDTQSSNVGCGHVEGDKNNPMRHTDFVRAGDETTLFGQKDIGDNYVNQDISASTGQIADEEGKDKELDNFDDIHDDDSPFPPLRPFATQEEIDKYEFEKARARVYQKHNMFYVPSYEDTPQRLPNIVSIREESTTNAILKKSLNRESFTYNSWLSRNSYNTSLEHAHIVDDDAVPIPGQICAKVKQKNTSLQLIQPRRISEIPAYRRPSIVTKSTPQTLLNKKQYTWIEGVHIKSKDSEELCFEDFGILRRAPERSPHECDERMFTFKGIGNKKSVSNGTSKPYISNTALRPMI